MNDATYIRRKRAALQQPARESDKSDGGEK